MKTYTHPTLLWKAEPCWKDAICPDNYFVSWDDWWFRIDQSISDRALIELWFIEDKQEDWIEKICYELEPDVNLWYNYLMDKEKLLSRNETANISRDRIRQAILKHLPK